MPYPFPNCDRFFMHASMLSHISGIFCEAIRWPRVRIKARFACGVATQMASAALVCTARKLTAIVVSRTIGYG